MICLETLDIVFILVIDFIFGMIITVLINGGRK